MDTIKGFTPIKRKVLLAYHQDGILDLVTGSVVLGFGLNMLTNNIVFLMIGWLAFLMYVLLKQRITIPRFGYVRFEPKEKNIKMAWFLFAFGVLVLVILISGYFIIDFRTTSTEMQALTQQYHMVPLSAMLFGLPSLAAAIILGLKRFYLYALLLVVLPALGAWRNIETFIPIVSIGIIIVAFGIGLLTVFLKKYPLEKKEDGNVG
ncbi:hypothetical protein ACFLXB_00580 [Chloroflexota bacterium]